MKAPVLSPRKEKVVMIGPPGVGKSAITNRIVQDVFRPNTVATVGAAFMSKVFTINNQELRLDIWDTGGSERYRSLAPMYYREARGAVVVFDLTEPNSRIQAAEWIDEIREQGRPDIVLVGAANKNDLMDQRKIAPEEVLNFARENQLDSIFEVSAKTGNNVTALFARLSEQLVELAPVTPDGRVPANYITGEREDKCGC
jgi:small GTP-binding protein